MGFAPVNITFNQYSFMVTCIFFTISNKQNSFVKYSQIQTTYI